MRESPTAYSMHLIPKDGKSAKQFYKRMIPMAEAEFLDYLNHRD